jgi:hypothetical protein
MRSAGDQPEAALGHPLSPRKGRSMQRKATDYDGSEIKRTRPRDYKLAVKMLGSGISKQKIAETLGMAWWTVSGIERSEFTTVQERRQRLAERFYSAATASIDSAEQRALEGKATALDAKLLSDTWLTLCGEPVATIEVQHCFSALDEFGTCSMRDVTPAD